MANQRLLLRRRPLFRETWQMPQQKSEELKEAEIEMVLYQKITMGTGARAGNAWLQEASDPMSKATWDNYVMISPELGKKLFDIDIFNPHQSDQLRNSSDQTGCKTYFKWKNH